MTSSMRVLPVLGNEPAPELTAALPASAPVRFGEGFHYPEIAEGLPFHWMSTHGRIDFDAARDERYLELWVRSKFYDLSQRLTARSGEARPADLELVHDWNPISVRVPAGADHVAFQVSRDFPRVYYPGDG